MMRTMCAAVFAVLLLAAPAHAGEPAAKPGMTAAQIGTAWACGALDMWQRDKLLAVLLDRYPTDTKAIIAAADQGAGDVSASVCRELIDNYAVARLIAELLPPRG